LQVGSSANIASLFSDNAFAIFNFVSSPPDKLLPVTL